MAPRAPSQRSSVSVDFSGPFFTKDPEKTILENVHRMMQGIASEGASALRAGLATGSGQRELIRELGDRVADHVIGRVESRTGKNWLAAAVVQVDNSGYTQRQAISLMAAASYVERRTAATRRVTRQISANRANLTEGLE